MLKRYRGPVALHLWLFVAASFLGAICPSQASAGGWVQPQGDFYLKAWDRSLVGSTGYLVNNTLVEVDGGYQDHSLNIYAEYGLHKNLTGIISATPIGYANVDGNGIAYFGPLGLGLRLGKALGQWNLALEARYGYTSGQGEQDLAGDLPPLGDSLRVYDPDSPDLSFYSGDNYVYLPAMGKQNGDLEIQVGHATDFGWWSAHLGLRVFDRDSFDPVSYGGAQAGFNLGATTLDIHSGWYWTLGPIDINNISGSGETQYISFGFTASRWLTPSFAITGSIEGAAAFVANANTPSLIVGIEMRSGE